MTTNDNALKSYARNLWLRSDPQLEDCRIEDLLTSEHFKTLKNMFDQDLQNLQRQYLSKPLRKFGNASTADVRQYEMKDLRLSNAQPPVRPASVPATPATPSAPSAPAAVPMPAPAPAPIETPAPAPTVDAAVPVPVPVPVPPPAPDLADASFRLPNARAGDIYQQSLEKVSAADPVIYISVTLPPGLALTFDPAGGAFSGIPGQAGEPLIGISYRYASQPAEHVRHASVKLVINANPKSMWRDLPSDQADIYWRPDQQSSQLAGAALRAIAASKRGRSHAHVGSFRDDDYAIAHLPDTQWYIGIVADGAGSARFSRKGAAIICAQARSTLENILAGERSTAIDQAAEAYYHARSVPKQDPKVVEAAWQTLRNALYGAVGNAAYFATKGIFDEATVHKETQADTIFKDYSSTALIAICKRYSFGTLCAAYWVGDGAVGIYSKKHGITLLGDVDSGEFSGQTRFLESAEVTQEALIKRTRFDIVDDMTALVVMTDGVSDPKFETEARLVRADDWHALWNELDQAVDFNAASGQHEKLLNWLDFWSQGNHDDRTIAIIY